MAAHRSFRHNPTFGLTTPDAYTAAWVSLVPRADLTAPAWPTALKYVRSAQLEDGGWGDRDTYYAHDRAMSTMTALWALMEWRRDSQDDERIEHGISALHRYVSELQQEPYETIGFELILPRLLLATERLGLSLPYEAFLHVVADASRKLERIGRLTFDSDHPSSWWISAEALPEDQLASSDDRILNVHGNLGIFPSTTAAYLRALRHRERDSQIASSCLTHLLDHGGICQLWPIDSFEIAWTLDHYRRAQMSSPLTATLLRTLSEHWKTQQGLGFSSAFLLIDGDETAVAYTVLHSAGMTPSDEPLMYFWRDGIFHTYLEEYKRSVSAHVHALTAFLLSGKAEHREIAVSITEWLRTQPLPLQDKWHLSPFYATSRLIPALIGWDDDFAGRCIHSLLEHQHEDGGWGYRGASTAEETSYAALGLMAAWRAGQLTDPAPLQQAKGYLTLHHTPSERLWIGKVLYQPIGVVRSAIDAARGALETI